jgi:hypothetical protein
MQSTGFFANRHENSVASHSCHERYAAGLHSFWMESDNQITEDVSRADRGAMSAVAIIW